MDGGKTEYPDCVRLEAGASVPAEVYGARARAVVRLLDADLPVPRGWAFATNVLERAGKFDFPADLPMREALFGGQLMSMRPSPQDRAWGGPETLLNIGMNAQVCTTLSGTMGEEAATALYFRFVKDYAVQVARLDAEDFDDLRSGRTIDRALELALAIYEDEMDDPFPQNAEDQLKGAMRSMALAWGGTSARILREAMGAPSDAGLGIIIQDMVLGVGQGEFGSGVAQFISPVTGEQSAFGRYRAQSQGRDVSIDPTSALFLSRDARGESLQERDPDAFETLRSHAETARRTAGDDQQLEFTIEDGQVWLLDSRRAERSGRAAVELVVRQVEDGILTRDAALLRVAPRSITEMLHPQIDPKAERTEIAAGIAASPGAATGKLVFSASGAQAAEARSEASILVRTETSPDDVRGMHSANGILTERGGITSHAAVVARGLGLPCVVGASDIEVNARKKTLTLSDGTVLKEGAVITLDGSNGTVLSGAPRLVEPELGGAFRKFLGWADEVRQLGVRCNADTAADVRMAQAFGIDGIGLVRTEHMVFEEQRLTTVREMLLADSDADREAALSVLLPMQRDDFIEIFTTIGEAPICIRLLDLPLHEFLPTEREEMQSLADAMNLPLSKIVTRVEDLSEFNPMLGTRGVRMGIVAPRVYQTQARAIFEAAVAVKKARGLIVKPEIMVPLVSANREVELVKAGIDAMAAAVRAESGEDVAYEVGVMVETPRAALRAQDIARASEFLSFGTNDLTQMTYGISRDDAGRFMSQYVANDVFEEDPFHTLDTEGVGELIRIAISEGRKAKPAIKTGLCGEHGGDPASVAFCHGVGFDYVSCSPFRTPIAKLAAAQAAIAAPRKH